MLESEENLDSDNQSLDTFNLEEEVLVISWNQEDFERDWTKMRQKNGSIYSAQPSFENREFGVNFLGGLFKGKYLTFIGHSVVNEEDENCNPTQGFFDLTDEQVIACIVESQNQYPTIDTINFFTCWSAALVSPECLEQRNSETGYNLTFCERMIVKLAEEMENGKYSKNCVDNLTVVGCMGLATYSCYVSR
jgi:hypothetical protein